MSVRHHVVFATYDLPPCRGGVARYHGTVVRALGGACTTFTLPTDRHWLTLLPRLYRTLRTARADLLLVGELLPIGTLAWLLRRVGGPPYAVICHGLDLHRATALPRKRWLARHVLHGAVRIIANSAFTASLARDLGGRPEHTTVVHPPIGVTPALLASEATEQLRTTHALTDRPIVLSVGRLVERKGFDVLVRAMREMGNPLLVIVGNGPERERLQRLARERRVDLRIVTNADDATLASWYAACDVFALLPRALPDGDVEGFGIVYLEAGAFGKPVIGTRSGGVPEAIVEGETGVLVPPNDANAAGAAIAALLHDRSRAGTLGAGGRVRVARAFTEVAFTQRIRAALRGT